jgi:hypothetical protein
MTRAHLYRLFHENADTLRDWLRLASSPTNPHQADDLMTCAEYLGRVELLAAIIHDETGDTAPRDEAEDMGAEFDRIRYPAPVLAYYATLFDSDEAEWEYTQTARRA